MKKFIFLLIIIMGGSAVFQLRAQVEQSIPFNEAQYYTDNNYFRARGVGTNVSQEVAKKIAMLNAKAEIAAQVQVVIQSVTVQFLQETKSYMEQNITTQFAQETKAIVQQNLKGVRLVPGAEKLEQDAQGKYTYWVVLEYKKQDFSEQPAVDQIFDFIEENRKIANSPAPIETPKIIKNPNSTKPQNKPNSDCSELSDPKARLDCDKEKFKKVFNEEMKELDKN